MEPRDRQGEACPLRDRLAPGPGKPRRCAPRGWAACSRGDMLGARCGPWPSSQPITRSGSSAGASSISSRMASRRTSVTTSRRIARSRSPRLPRATGCAASNSSPTTASSAGARSWNTRRARRGARRRLVSAPRRRRGAATGAGWPDAAQALADVDAGGCNAVEFDEFTFVPTQEAPDHDHPDFRRTMRWYYPFAPRSRTWCAPGNASQGRVDLASSGGHAVEFPGRRIYPERFRLLHYLFLGRSTRCEVRPAALRRGGIRRGWHGWRATLGAGPVRLPSQSDLRSAHADGDLDPSSPRTEHCLLWSEP